MRCALGIDLGSTTSKAMLLGPDARVLGRGITNTRSSYEVAVKVARAEVIADARLSRIGEYLERGSSRQDTTATSSELRRAYGVTHAIDRFSDLRARILDTHEGATAAQQAAIARVLDETCGDADEAFAPLALDRSRFFRDVVGSRFLAAAGAAADRMEIEFAEASAAWDRAILLVENGEATPPFEILLERALARARLDSGARRRVETAAREAEEDPIELAFMVGTGYGRQRLPFPKEGIRSEILCHGLGAHALFPETRTVLDIGGQDTKAIQVDADGLVTGFQMNDRCAAGCGRYLGYIADEMSLGVHEIGPLALTATRPVRISSTCTVFAGIELRDLLSTGERRENILLGLHRAIVLRAMGLLARSGGVKDEFTFTGGVARNPAVVKSLRDLVARHYGTRSLNIHTDSIYTGALGAALFALRQTTATPSARAA